MKSTIMNILLIDDRSNDVTLIMALLQDSHFVNEIPE